jgi:hypothetical protein
VVAHSDYPVERPLITGVLLDAIHEANELEGRRPKAFDTITRYSDAGKCGRAIGFDALKTEPSDPPDLASEWVMWLGKLIHEQAQDAILASFPGAIIEATSRIEDIVSGHADALIVTEEHGRILYELKSKGAFGFDKAVGIRRPRPKLAPARINPEGPPAQAKLQGALNAVALDCDKLIIGMISMEAVSLGLAETLGLNVHERIMGEWMYDKSEFGPWAKAELQRMEDIAGSLSAGVLPARVAIGDEMETISLNPHAYRRPWFCQYCSHLITCLETD